MTVLDASRIGIAALSFGMGEGAYEATIKYGKERKAFEKWTAHTLLYLSAALSGFGFTRHGNSRT